MRAVLDELMAAVRGLARGPAFTALAVGVLGLGLAAVIFMFGVIDTMMLRPAPYPDAERIYRIDSRSLDDSDVSGDMPPQDYAALRDAQTGFEAIGAAYTGTVYLTGDGQAERYDGGFVTASIFDVAHTTPELGRRLQPQDDLQGAAPVVVLGHDLWRSRFGSDPAVIGRTLRINGAPTEVVGVMPAGYAFPTNSQLWLPSRLEPFKDSRFKSVSVQVYGLLRNAVPADAVMQEFAPVAARIHEQLPDRWNRRFETVPFAAAWIGDDGRQLLWTLMGAVGLVLLIACANVSNLLLTRAAYRIRETSVRSALGATRGRLVAHVLAEGLVISTVAALLGLLLASLALDAMRLAVAKLMQDSPTWWAFDMDRRVIAVAVAVAMLSTLVAGLPAALRASRPALDGLLRDGGRMGTGLAIGRVAWGLVVFEVALACTLLGGAALMAQGVWTATQSDVGVNVPDYMTARVGLPSGTFADEAGQLRFWENLLENIARQPGVEAVAATTALPMHGGAHDSFSVDGVDLGDSRSRPKAFGITVSRSFFDTFRMAPSAGRLFDTRDTADGLPVVVINESMARAAWPGRSPLGARVKFDDRPESPWRTVIGVVPDILHANNGRPEPAMYVPIEQEPAQFMSLVARGPGGPRSLVPALRDGLAATEPNLALYWIRTLDEALLLKTSGFRIVGTMFAIFAAVALALAAAGLYGVLAFHVGQRTRELGVRRALGADDGNILRLVARATGAQVLVGVIVGMALLPFLGRGLQAVMAEMNAFDPLVYSLTLLAMLCVALVATWIPTRRALRVDPAVALRYE
jgi:predicted permease